MTQKKVTLTLPNERFELMELSGDGKPAICLVNAALVEFKSKEVFSWQCSLVVKLKHLDERNMPTQAERQVVDQFFQQIDAGIKKNNNALFLARVTWNKTQQWIWQLHNPEAANDYLLQIVEAQTHARPFNFSIDADQDWARTQWLLDPLKK